MGRWDGRHGGGRQGAMVVRDGARVRAKEAAENTVVGTGGGPRESAS